jgi:hypothetical protein
MKRTKNIYFFLLVALFMPLFAYGLSGEERADFFVEKSFDSKQRSKIEGRLELITNYIYFYVDNTWWEGLSEEEKRENQRSIYNLGNEFEHVIYPQIKRYFGEFPKNSIVGEEERINVLFHPMEANSGGYFRSGDQYSIYQYPRSNEANILYLNAKEVQSPRLPGYLAHEYMHLITFNEKNRKRRVSEEIWLNELRAEAIITILGYDDDYEKSNLKGRVETFLRDPDISLTEWTEQIADYGVINLFAQYILDYYGKEILADSLKTDKVGITSIDYALRENGFKENFNDVFTNWTIAVYLNDCTYGDYYCYKNKNLQNVRISPATVFIPVKDSDPLSISYQTKNWAGNWYRIVGGSGTLELKFNTKENFIIPYILCKKTGECEVFFLEEENKLLVVEDFNSLYESVAVLPSLQEKRSGFNGPERTVSLTWEVEVKGEDSEENYLQEIRERLVALRKEIEKIYNLLGISVIRGETFSKVERDLYYGMRASKDVENLQRFLRAQGKEIYPEGHITGNFLDLTKKAVIRFQEKYYEEILTPFNLQEGTGYVGQKTRTFINSLIAEN